MSDRRSTRQDRAFGVEDEHLLERDKQRERQTETDDERKAIPGGPSEARRGQHVERGPEEEETRDRVDEASEESFPASDPPQQP
jgi:hypothetical protein